MVEIFRARSTNGVVLQAPRRPASIATAVGRGLGDLGAALGAAAENDARATQAENAAHEEVHRIENERLRSRRTVEFGAALADARLEYVRRSQEARGQTAPGAPDWEARAAEIREEVFGGLLEPYSDDPELAEQLGRTVQSVTLNIAERELAWELEQRSEWEGTAYEKALQVEADELIDDPTQLMLAAERMGALLSGTDFDGTTKAKISDLTLEKLANSAFDGLARRGAYDQIEKLLESGAFDGALGKGKAAWLDRIDAGREQLARQAELEVKEVQAAVQEQAAQVRALVDAGEDVPASTFNAVAKQMREAKVPESEVIEFLGLATKSVRAQTARQLSTPVLEASIAELQAKVNAGKGDGQDAAQLEALEDELGRRDDKAADGLTGLSSKNITEQGMAVEQLASMPEQRRFSAAEKAGDMPAAIIAGLPPRARALALQGRQVRANNPDAYMPPNTQGKSDKGLLDAEFRRILGPQITAQLIQTNMYEATREAAADYLVGNQAQRGGDGKWGRAAYERAVSIMFGARQRADGAYAGGLGDVRGRRVELPDRYTAEEFDAEYSKLTFKDAVYGNGAAVKKEDVLANFTPVFAYAENNYSYYQLHDAQGRPLQRRGSDKPYYFAMKAK